MQIETFETSIQIWEVHVTLTNDNDPELFKVTEKIHEERLAGWEGWLRLGMFMMKLVYFDEAEELYYVLLDQTDTQARKAYLLHQIGYVKENQKKYTEAIEYYEKSLDINTKIPAAESSLLGKFYNNMAGVYHTMGEHSKALYYYEWALEITRKKFLEIIMI